MLDQGGRNIISGLEAMRINVSRHVFERNASGVVIPGVGFTDRELDSPAEG